jgi:hypothetical protein
VQRVELGPAAVFAPLPQQSCDEPERPGEGGLRGGAARDFAADVAEQAAQPSAQVPDLPLGLAGAPRVDQLRCFAPGAPGHSQVGLAQLDPVPPGQPRQGLDAAVEQLAVGRMRHRLRLDGGVDGDAPQVPLLDSAATLCGGQALGQQRLQPLRPEALAPARHR